MSAATESAAQLALRGLLLLVVEVQNHVRAAGDPVMHFAEIQELIDSDHSREFVQLARAALASTPASTNRKTFYAIVSEQDLPKDHKCASQARGPILMETYLGKDTSNREHLEAIRARFAQYGWSTIAEVLVDIPATPAAIPAAAAGMHV